MIVHRVRFLYFSAVSSFCDASIVICPSILEQVHLYTAHLSSAEWLRLECTSGDDLIQPPAQGGVSSSIGGSELCLVTFWFG